MKLSLLLLLTVLTACDVVLPSSPEGTPTPNQASPPGSAGNQSHLTIAVGGDLARLGPQFVLAETESNQEALELWHSTLATLDERGNPVPRLAAALPSLDDGTWQVNADGTMVTTYDLRPGVRWHDGAPFTADDVLFSYELATRLPSGGNSPIDRVDATGPLRVAVYWKAIRSQAGALREALEPYPRRLLPRADTMATLDLLSDPYWTTDYVGLGPFRVERFVPRERLELRAFDQYFLGRARLDTITLKFGRGRGELLEALGTDAVDVVLSDWGAPEAVDARAVWESTGGGTVLIYPRAVTLAVFPWSDADVDPREFRDPTFRRGLAAAINREQTSFADSLGLLPSPVTWIPPADPRWGQAAPYVTDSLAYSPSRAFQLLGEAGWNRDGEGRLRDHDGRQLTFELRSSEAPGIQGVVARYWSEIGAQLDLTRETVPGSHGRAVVDLQASAFIEAGQIGRLMARQSGSEADRAAGLESTEANLIFGRYAAALRLDERLAAERDLVRLATRDVPLLALGFHVQAVPIARGVSGLLPRSGLDLRPWVAFNAHEWSRS